MAEKKYKYQVKPGHRWGPFFEYGPGMTVDLTEDEADGFLDSLMLVKEAPTTDVNPQDEIDHLATLTIAQLKELQDYKRLENPKPKSKDKILAAIYEVRGLEVEA